MAKKPQKQPKTPASSKKAAAPAPEIAAAQVPELPVRDQVVKAALSLAAVQGWESCTVRDIASEAGLPLDVFYDHFADKTAVIAAYGRQIDRQVLRNFAEPDYETQPRDRLFDILMERLDLLNQDRDAVLSILQSFRLDPKQAVISLPHLAASMTRMLEAANLDTNGLRGAARVAGLSAGYLWTLKTWREDDSEDLGKTMAVLDKCIGRMEKIANTVGL